MENSTADRDFVHIHYRKIRTARHAVRNLAEELSEAVLHAQAIRKTFQAAEQKLSRIMDEDPNEVVLFNKDPEGDVPDDQEILKNAKETLSSFQEDGSVVADEEELTKPPPVDGEFAVKTDENIAPVDDEKWPGTSVSLLTDYGLNESQVKLLTNANLHTLGDMNSLFKRDETDWMTSVKGIGKSKQMLFEEAFASCVQAIIQESEVEEVTAEDPSETVNVKGSNLYEEL